MKKKVILSLILVTASYGWADVQPEIQLEEPVEEQTVQTETQPEVKPEESTEETKQDVCADEFEEMDDNDFLDTVADDVKDVEHQKQEIVINFETIKMGISVLWEMYVVSSYNSFVEFLNGQFGTELSDDEEKTDA